MYTEKIDELEVLILEKRLEVLKSKGLTGRLLYDLGDDFFQLVGDGWTFDALITTIHGMQEVNSQARDDAVGATLPKAKKKRGRKSKKELALIAEDRENEMFFDL